MSLVQRRLLISVLAVTRHPRTALAVVLVVAGGAVALSLGRLSISSDQNKLFSAKVPFFRDYLNFIKLFRENEAVYVVIEPIDPRAQPPLERWTQLAERITERLKAQSTFVAAAHCKIPLDKLGRQGVLFDDPKKLPETFSEAKQMVPLARLWGQKPDLAMALLGKTPMERFIAGAGFHVDASTADFVALLARSWTASVRSTRAVSAADLRELGPVDPSRLGYFYVPNELDPSQHRILVRVYPRTNFDSLTAVTRTVDAIRDTATQAAADFPEFHIGVTGRPALDADQMRISDEDSRKAEIVALAAVFVGLVVMLRSFWLALAAELALAVAIVWTFGWATATVGELNLLSLVFLIALIGIGMDYLVQILSRYRLEARRYQRPGAVWVRVFRHVGPPINTACLGAAGAFLVSVFTDFRGAADLGIVAGGGLLLCLISGYTFLPALLTLIPPKLKPYSAADRYRRPPRPRGPERLAMPAAWMLCLAAVSPLIAKVHFDAGLLDLQVQHLESVKLVRTLQTWVAVVLDRDLGKLAQVRRSVANLPGVASTESVLNAQDNARWLAAHDGELPGVDWTAPEPIAPADLPRLANQSALLAERITKAQLGPSGTAAANALQDFAAALRDLDKDPGAAKLAAARLSRWQVLFVDELRQMLEQFRTTSLDMSAVPDELRSHLESSDVDPAHPIYALYIYPRKDLWEGTNLKQFITSVEDAVATVPGAPRVTGIASNVYHTTDAIHRAFYEATFYALALIFVLVLLDFRQLGATLLAISVLALGLPMLIALMGLANVNWNFANFFGLPILIGAGHEYGVFLVHRYLEAKRNPRRAWQTWDVSDRALLLCAFVTSSSFGFFWLLAEHQGLRSLGLVMALGTACIYLAAVVVLRPMLRWRLDRRAKRTMAAT